MCFTFCFLLFVRCFKSHNLISLIPFLCFIGIVSIHFVQCDLYYITIFSVFSKNSWAMKRIFKRLWLILKTAFVSFVLQVHFFFTLFPEVLWWFFFSLDYTIDKKKWCDGQKRQKVLDREKKTLQKHWWKHATYKAKSTTKLTWMQHIEYSSK